MRNENSGGNTQSLVRKRQWKTLVVGRYHRRFSVITQNRSAQSLKKRVKEKPMWEGMLRGKDAQSFS